jgi:hypothetical protein
MKREIIAILTLGSFIVFSFSCYSVQPIKPEMLSSPKADKIEIRKIEKTCGESIDFSKSDPGRVRGNFVTGTGTLTTAVELVEIASADVQTVSRQDETFQSVKTRDGKSYGWVKKIEERGDKSILYVVKAVSTRVTSLFKVSLSEVEKAWAKRLDPGMKALLIVYIGASILISILWFTSGGIGGGVYI